METAIQSSSQDKQSKLVTIEAIELTILGFLFWSLVAIILINEPNTSFSDLIIFLAITEGILLGSWAIYNFYIRIARAGGKLVDIGIWIVAAALTGSYTFWAWTILDGNRLIVSKLFYRGDAPVEYAWSARSKQVRKAWNQVQKVDPVYRMP